MKYKKTVEVSYIVEAIQFTRENFEEVERFTGGKAQHLAIERSPDGVATCQLEGNQVTEGDYIRKTEDGRLDSVSQYIFMSLYKEVKE